MTEISKYTADDGESGLIKDSEEKDVSYIAVATFIYFLLDSGLTASQLSEALKLGQRAKGWAESLNTTEADEYAIKVTEPVTATHAQLLVDNFLLKQASRPDDSGGGDDDAS